MRHPPELPAPCRLIAFETLDSTNEEARRLAGAGAEPWTFVSAREQTAGRGRRGNSWVSPPGNLYLSAILRPECDVATAAHLGFVAALALADAIADATGIEAALKWPNDLLVDGGKVSGILVESAGAPGRPVDWVVIGAGINVASHPTGIAGTTDLAAHGATVSVERMLEGYVRCLVGRVEQWQGKGFAATRRDWLARATGIGGWVRVRLAGREEGGIFEDLDESGALVLVQGTRRRLVTSGEVFPAGAA
jgi:BirA family biotin operon repressor/biotin-[acetyl-CoA-carboxylase] ligase